MSRSLSQSVSPVSYDRQANVIHYLCNVDHIKNPYLHLALFGLLLGRYFFIQTKRKVKEKQMQFQNLQCHVNNIYFHNYNDNQHYILYYVWLPTKYKDRSRVKKRACACIATKNTTSTFQTYFFLLFYLKRFHRKPTDRQTDQSRSELKAFDM